MWRADELRTVRYLPGALALALLLALAAPAAAQTGASLGADVIPAVDYIELFQLNRRLEPLYGEMLSAWEREGLRPVEGVYLEIPGGAYAGYVGEVRPRVVGEFEGRQGSILLWEEEDSTVIWEVTVDEPGLYWIGMSWHPLPGKRASAMRDVKVNGAYPFNEARRLEFERVWMDVARGQDNRGNDIRPAQVEAPQWLFKYFEDADGMYDGPFLFPLRAGVNRIELRSIREPIAVEKLVVASMERLPTYEEVLAQYRALGYQEVKDVVIKLQAEDVWRKSDPTVRKEFRFEPLVEPESDGYWRLNSFGGWRWRKGGQWATWRFTVPVSGLYKIGVKTIQSHKHVPSIREVRIDGKIPFAELAAWEIPYSRKWAMTPIGDRDGNAYLIYLEAGEHELQMRVKLGRNTDVVHVLEKTVQELASLAMAMQYITGSDPDPYMEWELHKKIPGLIPSLEVIRDRLLNMADELRAYAGKDVEEAEVFEMTANQIQEMIADPYMIHTKLSQFAEMQSRLGQFVLDFRYSPAEFDYFYIAAPDAPWPQARASFWQELKYQVAGFLESFRKDYAVVGNFYSEDDREQEQVLLKVWVAWGREWAEAVKEMIDEDFTPNTGILVNVNVIPRSVVSAEANSVILLALASGDAPDVAFGVDSMMPVEFAIRGGVVDMSQFDDFEEVLPRFRDGMLIPYQFELPGSGHMGTYALPETQSFNMMFYRLDILGDLGLAAPQTWQEVLEILPDLQQRGMNFYYPSAAQVQGRGSTSFAPFLFQMGGQFYTEDGLRSALDTPEALQAFRLWTSLFRDYKIPNEANFYTRMRSGEMPIGVADYFTYVQLSTAAPELTGWWKMVPIPGIRKENGVIDRSAGGTSTAAVIFRDTEHPEAAWELVKWWTSTDVQTRYAEEIEAIIGVEARWNTANVQAFENLPWPREDLEAILEQWKWFVEKPVVLGDYFTTRHIINAWNRVVLEGWNPREALEKAVLDINRELIRKQEEFGVQVPEELKRELYRRGSTISISLNE